MEIGKWYHQVKKHSVNLLWLKKKKTFQNAGSQLLFRFFFPTVHDKSVFLMPEKVFISFFVCSFNWCYEITNATQFTISDSQAPVKWLQNKTTFEEWNIWYVTSSQPCGIHCGKENTQWNADNRFAREKDWLQLSMLWKIYTPVTNKHRPYHE